MVSGEERGEANGREVDGTSRPSVTLLPSDYRSDTFRVIPGHVPFRLVRCSLVSLAEPERRGGEGSMLSFSRAPSGCSSSNDLSQQPGSLASLLPAL